MTLDTPKISLFPNSGYGCDYEMSDDRSSYIPVLARAPLRGERVGGGAGVDRVVHQGHLLIQLHRPVHEAVPLEAPHHLPRPHDRAADVWRQRGHLLQRAGTRVKFTIL